jgi:hypothetical protein
MKTTTLTVLILMLTFLSANGQASDSLPDHRFYSLHLQLGQNQIKEMILFPLVHKGIVTELSFEKEKIKTNLRLFRFYLTYSRLKTGLEEMSKSANISLGLGYSYNFLVFQKNNFRFYSGPQGLLHYSLMIYPNWDESHSYWSDYLSVGVNNVLSLSLREEREWFTSLNFSLLGFFSRPDDLRQFKMDDYTLDGIFRALNSDIETGSMNKLLQINFRTEYRFPVLASKREAITFNMDILRSLRNNGKPVFQIINSVGLKIIF